MAVSMGTLKPSPHSFIIEPIDNADRAISFQSLSFASSHLSGDKLISPASLRSRRCSSGVNSYRSRTPVIVSPKAVSDSTNAQTCLDPDASRSVLGIILGGGAGTRLYPLTKKRAKPAVPLGANYRLIDISVSNCINCTISKIYVLTQFNSASLNRHLSRAYTSNMGGYKNEGFVEVLAAQQSPENPNWFQEGPNCWRWKSSTKETVPIPLRRNGSYNDMVRSVIESRELECEPKNIVIGYVMNGWGKIHPTFINNDRDMSLYMLDVAVNGSRPLLRINVVPGSPTIPRPQPTIDEHDLFEDENLDAHLIDSKDDSMELEDSIFSE
ncbi:Glucose-1-phosphate adenylyltransferase small subunit, chloroplastic [Capsicum annuum]|nr:Glucose-1-phosphate adenylyltransferase small subunit, chloroplastic [Capsicum annuum]KAF3680116.1 Glucose-1-phosphate adenylyltransferase small subunit, chloroplastic [Capsicum annuum]